jgi:hypothetical protein
MRNEMYFTQKVVNSSKEYSPDTQLSIKKKFNGYNRLFFNHFKMTLPMMHITHLDADLTHMSMDALSKLVNLLPNLSSLGLSSLSSLNKNHFSMKNDETICSIINNNQITELSIEQMTSTAQAHFVINLCPHLQYLHIRCTADIGLAFLLQVILMEKNKFIPNLVLIQLDLIETNDDILQKLLDHEKVLCNCSIKCVNDTIYLYWKS